MDKMQKRIVKMLRRYKDGRSMPDFDAVCEACDQGYADMQGPSDDITFTITPKGEQLLEPKP